MTTTTLTLAQFVLERVEAEEAAALAFVNGLGEAEQWRADEVGGKVRSVRTPPFGLDDLVAESDTHLVAAHIAAWDPARVLAQVAATRAIVERFVYLAEHGDTGNMAWVLSVLAAPYASHPDFDPAWVVS